MSEDEIMFTNDPGGDKKRPGFKVETNAQDKLTGASLADTGISRRNFIKMTIGAIITACGIGSVVTFLLGKTTQDVSLNPNQLSEPYKELMNNQGVKDALAKLKISQAGTGIEDTKTLLYNLTTTDAYLQEADSDQWAGLATHLETEGPKAFYGQMLALKKAGCLDPKTSKLDRNLCEATKTDGSAAHPGFKGVDEKTKLQYIGKFNSMVDQIKP